MTTRAPNDTQLAPDLPGSVAYVTGHNAKTGATTIERDVQATWQPVDNRGMAFTVPWTTSCFPVDLSNNKDISAHDERLGSGKLGLVSPGGTVLRFVDFAPGFESMMHRTQSLDYGIVVEGTIELILDSGDKRLLHRGDCCIQRGTNHAWRNPSANAWARVVYVLQEAYPVKVDGKVLEEDLGRSAGEIPASGNKI